MAKSRWIENRAGRIPYELNRKGARVYVRLRNGSEPPGSWAAQTTRWTLTTGLTSAFDVIAHAVDV